MKLPRIRTVLLGVNVIILLLPLAGIAFLRIYDNELLRQTEASLLAQGAVLQSTYRHILLLELHPEVKFEGYGVRREVTLPEAEDPESPRFSPSLDVRIDGVSLASLPAMEPATRADSHARAAGAQLQPVLHDTNDFMRTGISIVTWQGTVVASTGPSTGKSIGHRPEVKRALRGELVRVMQARESSSEPSPWESLTRRARVLVVVVVPVVWDDRVYGAVVLSRPPMSLSAAVLRNGDVFAGLFAVLVIAVSLITLLTTLTIQRPLRQLNRQTRRIVSSIGSAQPIENPGVREFEELSIALSKMASTLDDRNEYIRAFARNVSHEFKTPLASIQGSVELLEDHFDTMEEEKRSEFLSMIANDTRRLDRLVRRLLELARADVFHPTTEWVNASEVLPELARRAGVELTYDPKKELPVAMSRDALESVLTNLFDNAARHGGGNVRFEVVEAQKHYFKFVVSDDGPGISEANREKVFDSFFTTARDVGGTGLGLPIVRSLLERHGGDISLAPSESGAAFVVTVPRSA